MDSLWHLRNSQNGVNGKIIHALRSNAMAKPTGSIRPLFYPLDQSEDLISDTPNTPTIDHITLEDWQTTDPDERVNIVLNLSLNEYVALATCVDVGRDIAYGNESLYLWWIWVRTIKYMDLCALILECIENTEELQQAIANYAGSSNIDSTTPENASNLASELVNDPVGCDNDIIFGMTRQLVEFADRLIKDLFEQLSAAQLSSVNVGYLIKLIPVIETLPLDEAFELADKLVNDMETAYLSASTELLKDEIACDLFCLAQLNGCVLTLEMVRDYYQERADIVFSYDNPLDFMVDFINGTFVGNAVFYGMNIFFFQIFVFGGRFLEYFYRDYLQVIQSMYNDPDTDWTTLCDNCGWVYNCDFTVSNCGWVAFAGTAPYNVPNGVWVDTVGWTTTDVQEFSNNYARTTSPQIEFADTEITRIRMTYNIVKGFWEQVSQVTVFIQGSLNGVIQFTNTISRPSPTDGNEIVFEINPNMELDKIRLLVRPSTDVGGSGSLSGSAVITSIEVWGLGTNPF